MNEEQAAIDEEFDRKLTKDVHDNWAGILIDRILADADELQAEVGRIAHRRPGFQACANDFEPLLKRILQDSRDLKEALVEHGLIPVLSRRQE